MKPFSEIGLNIFPADKLEISIESFTNEALTKFQIRKFNAMLLASLRKVQLVSCGSSLSGIKTGLALMFPWGWKPKVKIRLIPTLSLCK